MKVWCNRFWGTKGQGGNPGPRRQGCGAGMGHQEAGGGRLSQGLGRPVLPLESAYATSLGWASQETPQGKERMGRGTRGCPTGTAGLAGPCIWQKTAPGRGESVAKTTLGPGVKGELAP